MLKKFLGGHRFHHFVFTVSKIYNKDTTTPFFGYPVSFFGKQI